MAQSPTVLFGTSWTVHRISPLYHSSDCKGTLLDNQHDLSTYATRLQEFLTGDTLQGAFLSANNNSLLDEALAKAGPLILCRWESLPTWHFWNEERSILEDPDQQTLTITPDQSAGILATLEYESATYRAAFLCDPNGYHGAHEEGVTYLPLLLTRMPNALRQAFISFLESTFDTRCSVLRVPSGLLCSSLESYLATLYKISPTPDGARDVLERVIKDVQLTLSLASPVAPALKSMDVSLPRRTVSTLYMKGLEMLQTSSEPTREGESLPRSSTSNQAPGPFMTALSEYFQEHLAMTLDISGMNMMKSGSTPKKKYVRLTKIACGAFVLGFEGRIKFLANPGRTFFIDESQLDQADTSIVEDVEEKEKRLIWKANEDLLQSMIDKSIGKQNQTQGENISGRSGT